MKVLLVNKFLYPNGGSETYLFKLGNFLEKMGHEVSYFGMEHEGRIVGNNVDAYTSDMDFHGGSKLSKLTYPIKTIYSSEAAKKIGLVLDDFKPDVVHLNNFTYQLTPSIITEVVKWRKKNNWQCRIVFTAHDYNLVCPNHMMNIPSTKENCERCVGGHFINCTKNRCIHGSRSKSIVGTLEGYFWKLKKTYRYIDKVICCSQFMKTKMDTNPLFKDKTIAIHNFIDEPHIAGSNKKDYVLYFGRYSEEKGIGTLIEVCKELPEVKFIFAGTGPLKDKLKDIDNIEEVGFKSGDELKKLVSEALFSVSPCESYENCPFTVIESQLYGTPVVGARIGGVPELIKDGFSGIIFESGNKEELKDKISLLWNDRSLAKKMSENCSDMKFVTIEEYYDKLMKIYSA